MENNEIRADEIKYDQVVEPQIKTIVYRRIHNLGNYNTQHLEMIADVPVGADVDQCTDNLIARVEKKLGLSKPDPKVESLSKPKPEPQPASADADPIDNHPEIPW